MFVVLSGWAYYPLHIINGQQLGLLMRPFCSTAVFDNATAVLDNPRFHDINCTAACPQQQCTAWCR